jgi:hypothetical protein
MIIKIIFGGKLMSASQSAVRSRAEAVQVSRTLDWMIRRIAPGIKLEGKQKFTGK